LAALTPLSPPPGEDAMAKEIMARLDMGYRFRRLTDLPAAQAATTLAKPTVVPSAKGQAPAEAVSLDLPRAVRTEIKPSAADIGEATHLLLQHVDFTRSCDIGDLKSQISDLVTKRLIAPPAAESIDMESICWLVGSPIGQILRQHAGELRRELPLYFALPPQELDPQAVSSDPRDRVMLRSRIDVLVPTPRGLEIVDYKTDRVARPELYHGQMKLYRRAIEAMTGQPVAAIHLVFLSARRIETVTTIPKSK
jgi:ATP-dependent helicase/nuclease subunit A